MAGRETAKAGSFCSLSGMFFQRTAGSQPVFCRASGLLEQIDAPDAKGAGDLPDIVRMGIERVAAFSADGLLDEEAATEVITMIGEDDFVAAPLFGVGLSA